MTATLHLAESAFAHYLPYWQVGEGVLVMHDGAMAIGYRLEGVDVACQPDDAVNAIAHQLRALLNAVPIGLQLQFLRRARALGPPAFEAYAASLKTQSPILREQRLRSAEHLRSQKLRTFDTYLLLSKPNALGRLGSHMRSPGSSLMDRMFGNRDPYAVTLQQHSAAAIELTQEADSMVRFFKASGVQASRLDDQQLLQLAFGMLNPARADDPAPTLSDASPPAELSAENERLYRALSLREQLVHSSLSWDVDSMTLDDPPRLYRVMGLKSLPPRTIASLIHGAVAIPFDHWLSVGLSAPDSEAKYNEVERRRNRAKAHAVGYVRNVRADVQASELEDVLEAMVARDQRVFQLSLNLLFSADSLSQLDQRTREAADVFRNQLAQTVLHTEQMAQLPSFLGMLPGNAHRASRRRTVLTDNAADFLPIYKSWSGDGRPAFLVSNRHSEPFQIDLADPRRTNWNVTVFGGSGGGKTFLVLALANSTMLGQGSPLIVIDVGGKELGSYYRLVSMLGGDFVGLSLDGSTCINPFYSRADLYTDDEGRRAAEPNELKLSFLLAIAKMLATNPGAPPMTRIAEGVLQKAISRAYARLGDARPPIFSDVVAELETAPGDREEKELARGFAKTLRAVLDGPFAKLLNQQSKVNIRSQFVVFDLKGLESIGDLAPVMLLIVTAYVWNMISRPRNELAWVIYDECWKLMMSETAASLQAELYRTARKLRTGVVSITQKMEDFLAAPSSKAVLSNTSTTFLMKHKDGHDQVGDLLSMNDRERQLFRGLKSEKGFYSEFFLKQETGSAVCRYSPSPFEYWVNTTDPKDRELESQILRQVGGDRLAALRLLSRQCPNGASARRGDA